MRKPKTKGDRETNVPSGVDGSRVGSSLKSRREELGWSFSELAKRAAVSVATAHALEHGKLSVRLDTFLRIADALGLGPVDLLAGVVGQPEMPRADFEQILQSQAHKDLPGLLNTILRLYEQPRNG